MIRRGPFTPQGGDDGFIIVPVLWILLTLAGLAGILSVYLANTAAALSLNDDRLRSAALVSSSLELTAYKLSAAAKAGHAASATAAIAILEGDMGACAVLLEYSAGANYT